MARRRERGEQRRGGEGGVPVALLGLAVFASQTVVLPGGASPFREPKWSVAGTLLLVGGAGALWRRARAGRLVVPRSSLLMVLALLPVAMALSALWSVTPARSLRAALWALAMLLVVWAMAGETDGARRRVAGAGIWGAVLSAGVGLFQALGVDPLGIAPVHAAERYRIVGLAGNPADLAAASLLAAAMLAWVVRDGGGRSRRGWLAAIPLLAVAAATSTLTAFAALAALAAVVLTLMPRRARLRVLAATVLLLALAAGVAWPRLESSWERVRSGDWYHLLSARGDGWSAAGEMIRERPLGGVGAAAYGCRFAPARLAWLERHGGAGGRGELATHFEWAHCDPVQLGAELGLAGWVWLAALAWALTRGSVRRHPAAPAMAAVVLPFALLHYPMHLAVVVLPLLGVVADVVSKEADGGGLGLAPRAARAAAAVVVVVLAGCGWMAVARLELDRWLGRSEAVLRVAAGENAGTRTPALLRVEREALARLKRGTPAPGRLWRVVGRCRLGRGAAAEAEEAFRRAMALCPHEEAWMGLGLAMAARGRRSEALSWLVRACRINPDLARLVPDETLRRAVREAVGRGGTAGG